MKNLKKEEYITKFEIKQNVINGNPAIRTIDAYKCLEEYKEDYVNNITDIYHNINLEVKNNLTK